MSVNTKKTHWLSTALYGFGLRKVERKHQHASFVIQNNTSNLILHLRRHHGAESKYNAFEEYEDLNKHKQGRLNKRKSTLSIAERGENRQIKTKSKYYSSFQAFSPSPPKHQTPPGTPLTPSDSDSSSFDNQDQNIVAVKEECDRQENDSFAAPSFATEFFGEPRIVPATTLNKPIRINLHDVSPNRDSISGLASRTNVQRNEVCGFRRIPEAILHRSRWKAFPVYPQLLQMRKTRAAGRLCRTRLASRRSFFLRNWNVGDGNWKESGKESFGWCQKMMF